VLAEPEVALLPLHAPDAVHEVASVEDQFKFELPPLGTIVGVAIMLSVGADAGVVTSTVTEADLVPPVPEQLSVKVLSLVSAPVDWLPLVDLLPDHAPEAVQPVAFAVLHARVALFPLVIDVGLTEKEIVGAGAAAPTSTVTEADTLPPAPRQLSAKVVSFVSVPVDCEPLIALLPDQPPEAVQLLAFALLQLRVELAPYAMEIGLAVSVNVGCAGADVELLTLTVTGVDTALLPAASRAVAVRV
jgi:hypothetical protein